RFHRPAIDRRRRRNGDLRRLPRAGGNEPEMLDHRVAGETDLAGDLDAFVARGDGSKGDAGVHHVPVDAIEAPQKVQMPPGAAKLPVSDRAQADLLLLPDDE